METDPPAPPESVIRTAAAPDLRDRVEELRYGRRRLLHGLVAVLGLSLLLALWILARLAASGFPASWERRVSEALSTPEVSVEASGMSFSLPRMRLRVDSVAVHPRGAVGRAALEIAGADLRLHPRLGKPGPEWLREVRIEALALDAAALEQMPKGSGERFSLPDFQPIMLSVRRVSAFGADARRMTGFVSARGGVLALEDFRASFHSRGEPRQDLHFRASIDPDAPSVEISGSGGLSFAKIVAPLERLGCTGVAAELSRFDFHEAPPALGVTFRWAPRENARSLRVSVDSGAMRYRGVRLSSLSGVVRVGGEKNWSRVELRPLSLARPEGNLSGSMVLDFADDTIAFDFVSSLDPLRFAALAGFSLDSSSAAVVSFDGSSDIRASGAWGMGETGPARTDISFSVSVPGATARGFRFSDVTAEGAVKGRVLDVPRVVAKAMDGDMVASARLDFTGGREAATLAAKLDLRDVPQARWAGLLGREADAKAGGLLDLAVEWEGPLSEVGAHVPERGKGSFSADVRKANVFRVPLFAGLTDVLADNIPGVDFVVDQNEAHVRATLDEGRWTISRLDIVGGAFSVEGTGFAAADGSDLDIVARVRIMNERSMIGRLVRNVLSPISGLFAVRGTGNASAPRWTMAPFSHPTGK